MSEALARVRGGKRKKLEKLIIDAGYIKEYVENGFNKYYRTENTPPKIFIAKLARAMKYNTQSFTTRFNNQNGIPLYLAQEILDFIKKNHPDINVNLKL